MVPNDSGEKVCKDTDTEEGENMRIQKREHSKRVYRGIAKGIFTAACMAVMVWCMPIVSLADATGKVIPNSVNIRKTPDVNSDVVGSSTIGKEVTIKGKVNASGTTWYQVYIDANTLGYIRSDMLEPEAEAEIPVVTVSTESSSSSTDAPAAQPQETASSSQDTQPESSGAPQADNTPGGAQVAADESVDLQYAKLKVNSRVRPDPSTKNNPVGSLTEGAQVVVSGKSAGSDGKDWYYVTYTSSNGSEKTGFVRSDLLEMGEMLQVEQEPPQEEVPVEEPEPEPVVNNDYMLRVEQTENGPVWYLDDNIMGQPHELASLLKSAYSQSEDEEEATAAVVKQRIVIVVLVILLVALIVAVVILAFKLRDAYYEDYEDDDDDEEEEEEERPRRRIRSEEPEEERTVRRRETQEAGERRRSSDRGERGERNDRGGRSERNDRAGRSERNDRGGRGERNDRGERSERRVSRERAYEDNPAQDRAAKTGAKRKSKNFLLDDDEFEFEFLNMDDKDLK